MMNKKYNTWYLFAGILVVLFLGGCDQGSGIGVGDKAVTGSETAAGSGCCQVSSRQCADVPSRSQCNAVQGAYMEGLSCNGGTHQCE